MAKKKTQRRILPLTVSTVSGKRVNLRKAIDERLAQLGKTRMWLVRETGLRVATVYEYLNGDKDIWAAKAESMLTALGLEIRPAAGQVKGHGERGRKRA